MILIKYVLSVLLYILLLPISTPAAFIVSTWTRPDDLDWGAPQYADLAGWPA